MEVENPLFVDESSLPRDHVLHVSLPFSTSKGPFSMLVTQSVTTIVSAFGGLGNATRPEASRGGNATRAVSGTRASKLMS